jgi:hypothetical protein
MSTAKLFLLISILIFTGVISLTSLYPLERALAVKSNCDPKVQSLFLCPLVSAKDRSFALETIDGEKEKTDIASGSSQTIAATSDDQSNGDENMNANIESKIPSVVNAIPFP